MSNMPETIYAEPEFMMWSKKSEIWPNAVKYIRADLYKKLLKEREDT